jgi:hypothetical protein
MTERASSPDPQQIEEWLGAEVTGHFLTLIRMRLERTYQARAEVYFHGEPFRTQESKAWLLGEETVLQDIVEAFESKDFSQIEETDEERVRNPSVRRPRPHPPG